MVGLFGWIEKTTGLNVSNYDFDDSGNAVSYTNPTTGASTSVSDADGLSSMDYAAEVGAYGLGGSSSTPVTETVVLGQSGGNYRVEDAFGNVLSIAKEDFTDWKRENDRKLAMIAGTYEPGDIDEQREMERVQERAAMGEASYAAGVRESERGDPNQGVVGDTSADVGQFKQDANGDWYTVKRDGNILTRDYSADPQDNSQGPTFGKNVSEYVAATFPDEVSAAGGSTDSAEPLGLLDYVNMIFAGETTDVPSVGFDASAGTTAKTNFSEAGSFGDAFAAARSALGPGQTFEYNGQTYSTAVAGEDPALDAALSGGIDTSYYDKLVAAGGSDTSTLDELAAADTSGISVFGPTDKTKAAIEEYYTTGAGAPGATQDVDYTQTSSGQDYEIAAQMDDEDISGGVEVFDEEEAAPDLSNVEKILVEKHNFVDNGDGTLTAPNGYFYDEETGGYTPDFAKTADLFPKEVSPVEVDTFSDEERVVPEGMGVEDLYGYENTVLESGTGGLSGIRTGDEMTPQLAAELGVNYFEGDTIQSSDLIELSNLGFDVSQADLTKANAEVPLDVDVTVSTGGDTVAGSGAVDQGSEVFDTTGPAFRDVTQGRGTMIDGQVYVLFPDGVVTDSQGLNVGDTAIESAVKEKLDFSAEDLASDTAERDAFLSGDVLPSRLLELGEYADSLTDRFGSLTEGDLLDAGFTADELAAYESGLDPNTLTEEQIAGMEPFQTEGTTRLEMAANNLTDAARLGLGVYMPGVLTGIGQGLQGVDVQTDQALRAVENALLDETYSVSDYALASGADTSDNLVLDDPLITKAKNFVEYEQGIIGKVGEFISAQGDKLQAAILTPEEIAEKNASAILGTLPQDLRIEGTTLGTALQIGQEVGEEALDLAVMMVTRNPLALGAIGAIGAGEAAAAAKQQADAAVQALYNEGKLQNNPTFLSVVEAIGEDQALKFFANEVLASSILAVSATGATDAAIKGKIGKALGEGAQEVAESAFVSDAVNDVFNLTGEDKLNIFQDASGNFVTGAVTGAIAGVTTDTAATAVNAAKNLANYDNAVNTVTETGEDKIGSVSTSPTDFDASSEVTPFTTGPTASEILNSGDNFEIGRNAAGDNIIRNTVTNESAVFGLGEQLLSGSDAGDAFTVADIASVETGDGLNVSYDGDRKTLTNDKTGFTVQLNDDTEVSSNVILSVNNNVVPEGTVQVDQSTLALVDDSLTGLQSGQDGGGLTFEGSLALTDAVKRNRMKAMGYDPDSPSDVTMFDAALADGTITEEMISQAQAAQFDSTFTDVTNTDQTASEILSSGATDATDATASEVLLSEAGGTDSGVPNTIMNDDYIAHPLDGTVTQSAVDLVNNPNYTQQQLLDVARENGIIAGPNTGILPLQVFQELQTRVNNPNLTVITERSTDVTEAGGTATGGTGGTDVTEAGGTDVTDATATDATAAAATDATDATDATAAAATDANTTTTEANNVTVTKEGDTTITTAVDANGNATVTTKNSVTGESTSDTVTVNDSATITNGNVKVEVDAQRTGTVTTVPRYVIEYDDIVEVEEPEVVVEEPEVVVEEPTTLVESAPVVSTPRVAATEKAQEEDKITPESALGYESAISGLGSLMRPTVTPYYQPQQTMDYSFYVPQPGVAQEVSRPTAVPLTSYLAPVTGDRRYGYGYIAPNAELDYLRRLAEIQATGAERLPSEDLMGS